MLSTSHGTRYFACVIAFILHNLMGVKSINPLYRQWNWVLEPTRSSAPRTLLASYRATIFTKSMRWNAQFLTSSCFQSREGDRFIKRWLSPCLSDKESTCSAEDTGSTPGLGRSPGEGNGNPLQYSCLGSPMDRGDWRATVLGVARVGHDWVTKQQNYKQYEMQWRAAHRWR